jgi:hypothetical protein
MLEAWEPRVLTTKCVSMDGGRREVGSMSS